jgi:cytochrome c biogenesis protein CcdA
VYEELSLDFLGLSLIFIAGALATLSPCSFPMLPGYVLYYLGSKTPLGKAFSAGVTCTFGLITVFSVIGVIVSTFGGLVSRYIPSLQLWAGAAVILMGVSMIANIKFPISFTRLRIPKQRGFVGIFLYGVVYGLATLSCSAPIFFSILFYAFAAGGFLQVIVTFIVYATGMGLPIIITTILVAKVKKFIIQKIVNVTSWLQGISGIILLFMGIYLISLGIIYPFP